MNITKSPLFDQRLFRLLLALAVVVVSIATLIKQPMIVLPHQINDKMIHGFIFFILSLLADFSFIPSNNKIKKSLWLLGFGIAIEAAQHFFTTTRMAEFMDVVADVTGIISYWLVALIIQKILPQPKI